MAEPKPNYSRQGKAGGLLIVFVGDLPVVLLGDRLRMAKPVQTLYSGHPSVDQFRRPGGAEVLEQLLATVSAGPLDKSVPTGSGG